MKSYLCTRRLQKNTINTTKMEEIRIYHSFWKRLLQSIFFIVSFGTMGCLFVTDEYIRDADFLTILTVIFVSISCLYGFFLMFVTIWERVGNKPFLTISDKGIAVNGLLKKKNINFADVVSFDFRQDYYLYSLSVFYNPEASKKKLEGLNIILRLLRQSKIYHEGIDISFIDMKAEELCNMLNEKLSQIPSPDVEEEPQVHEEEIVLADETVLRLCF